MDLFRDKQALSAEMQQRDEKYEGAPKAIEVLGKGSAYGWIGSGIGFVVGALFSSSFVKEDSKLAERVTEGFKKFKMNVSGKLAVVIASSLIVSKIGHYAGVAVGLKKGAKTAGHGREQFERLKTERDMLVSEVQALEKEKSELHEQLGKYTNAIDSRGEKGTHADVYSAEKQQEKTDIAR